MLFFFFIYIWVALHRPHWLLFVVGKRALRESKQIKISTFFCASVLQLDQELTRRDRADEKKNEYTFVWDCKCWSYSLWIALLDFNCKRKEHSRMQMHGRMHRACNYVIINKLNAGNGLFALILLLKMVTLGLTLLFKWIFCSNSVRPVQSLCVQTRLREPRRTHYLNYFNCCVYFWSNIMNETT